MNQSKGQNKKKLIIILSITLFFLAIVALIVGTAFAFFTGTDTKKNSFIMGDVEIELTEPNWNDEEDGKEVLPGATLIKDPTITATKGSSYARLVVNLASCNSTYPLTDEQLNLVKDMIYYDKSYDMNNSPVTANLQEGKSYSLTELNQLVADNKIEKLFNSTDFTLDQTMSGKAILSYNYNSILNEGEEKVLFTNIVVPTDYNREDLKLLTSYYDGTYNTCDSNSSVKIIISAEAIQATNINTNEAFEELNTARISSWYTYNLLEDDTYEITGESDEFPVGLRDIVLPNTYNGKTITKIGSRAFYLKPLSSVVIPDTITAIGEGAFRLSQLERAEIPDSVTSIGENAFMGNELTEVNIPNTITTLTEGVFTGNRITSIDIPDTVTSIEGSAFSSNQITSVVIPYGVTKLGIHAFYSNILENVSIPDTVTTIDQGAFMNNNLESIYIPNSVTTIGSNAFRYNKLKSITIPNALTTIDQGVFMNNNLESIDIPSSVTTIKKAAFSHNSLENITIPSSVTTIENIAFSVNKLTNVIINGKSSVNDFISYPAEGIVVWGWATDYSDSNITWNP